MAPKNLVVKGPKFLSPGDEKAFFDWLREIPCVDEVTGVSQNLQITFRRQPGNQHLRELVALFYRYRMTMKPLAALKTGRNAAWFAGNMNAFWYARVFGDPESGSAADSG